jgi:hypothetical protein
MGRAVQPPAPVTKIFTARPTRACDQVHANIMPRVTEARRCAMTLFDPSTR